MKLFYLRDENSVPVVCVASELDAVNNEVVFAISTQNPKDRQDKKYGRSIAINRLKNKFYEGKVSAERGIKERIVRYLANTLVHERANECEDSHCKVGPVTLKVANLWLLEAAAKNNLYKTAEETKKFQEG